MHLIIDGEGARRFQLASKDRILLLLHDLPHQMGMQIIKGPDVLEWHDANHPHDGGISGSVMIAESHISIHTFPERGLFWADVFSCKDFDTERAMASFYEAFGQETHLEHQTLPRGLPQSDGVPPDSEGVPHLGGVQ